MRKICFSPTNSSVLVSKIQPYFLGLTWLPKLGPIRALSRIYRLRKKPRVAKGHELPGGVRRHAPRKFFEMYMRGDAIWCILRNVTVCALPSSRRDDFSDIVTFIL